ncbi:MAG: hypothetical protein QXH56_07580 [Thermoprotei archaeon]
MRQDKADYESPASLTTVFEERRLYPPTILRLLRISIYDIH